MPPDSKSEHFWMTLSLIVGLPNSWSKSIRKSEEDVEEWLGSFRSKNQELDSKEDALKRIGAISKNLKVSSNDIVEIPKVECR